MSGVDDRRDEEDMARDAHLLAALRHAPDRDALPPAELSAAILAQARAAARGERVGATGRKGRFERWFAWLGSPQLTAAFGSLTVALLVGLMWSVQELPAPAAPAPAAKPQAAEPPVKAPPSADVARESSGLAATNPAVRRDAPAARRAAPMASTNESAPAAKAAEADAAATAAAGSAERRVRSERVAEASKAAAAAAPPAPAPALAFAPRMAAAPDPLAAFERSAQGAWAWSARGVDGPRAHGEPQRALWATMRQATEGRWRPADPAQPLAPWLIAREGARELMLWIGGEGLHAYADGRGYVAPLTPEQARDWQQAVGGW